MLVSYFRCLKSRTWFLDRSFNAVSDKPKYVFSNLEGAETSARYTAFGVKDLFSRGQLFLSLQLQTYSLFGDLIIFRLCDEIVKLIFLQQL